MGKALIIIVLGFSTIFSGMMFNLTANQQRSSEAIVTQYRKAIARNVVESVTNVAISKLYQDFSWSTGFTNQSFSGADYSVSVTDVTGDSTTEVKKIQLTTVVSYENVNDSTIAVLMRPAYSYFYFFLNNIWPSSLQYATGDTLAGPIHANPRIRIKGDPVFIARVSSADVNYHPVVAGSDPKFYGGVEFGTPVIPLPDLGPLIATATAGGHVFANELWLRFNGTGGTYDYSTDGVTYFTQSISDFNGTIMTTNDNDIHVEGTVDGQITILSDRDILIEDNIVYDDDPRINPNSDDYLGLIARHRVTIVENVANSSDIEIHAAIIAHHDEINVPNYDSGGPWGNLTIVGSIVENDFRPYGTTTPTGYISNHIYDLRLRDRTPPIFRDSPIALKKCTEAIRLPS